jgi:hypothetical protein
LTRKAVTAIWASGAAATVSPMSRNSSDPAKITQEKTLAHHQARPECATSIPKAMPMGKMASPTEPEIFSAASASDRGGSAGAEARADRCGPFRLARVDAIPQY